MISVARRGISTRAVLLLDPQKGLRKCSAAQGAMWAFLVIVTDTPSGGPQRTGQGLRFHLCRVENLWAARKLFPSIYASTFRECVCPLEKRQLPLPCFIRPTLGFDEEEPSLQERWEHWLRVPEGFRPPCPKDVSPFLR